MSEIKIKAASGSGSAALKTGTTNHDVELTLPTDIGSNDQYLKLFEDIKFKHPKKTLEKIVNCAILECVMTSCPVCNGVGYTTFNKTIEKCRHCNEGGFIYDDFTRCQIMTVKKATYGKIRRGYKKIMEMLYDLEQESLAKIGDT